MRNRWNGTQSPPLRSQQQQRQRHQQRRGRGIGPWGLRFALCLLASSALARPAAAEEESGTHFIAEAGAGALFGTGFSGEGQGFAMRATLGAGGRFASFPPRFYAVLVGRFGDLDSTLRQAERASDLERSLTDVSGGLRVLMPLWRLRFLGEITFGKSMVSSRAHVNDVESYETESEQWAAYFGAGVQIRLHRNVSLGALAEWSVPLEDARRDVAAALAGWDGDGPQSWTAVTGTLSAHF